SEDPFVLFQLRGRTRAQILDKLRQLRSKEVEEKMATEEISLLGSQSPVNEVQLRDEEDSTEEESILNINQFWQYDKPLDSSLVVITPPQDSRTVLDVLGTIPLAAADAPIMEYLEEVYQTVSQKAMMSALNS
ncbi:MAG: hypothetical protein F6K31_40235, partial [Symploca sp. SIO2G7]|nr:hypothetical protein [Symploca sp. SIO2G7]